MKILQVPIKNAPYKVYLDKGLLKHLGSFINDKQAYVIITDDGVPLSYIKQVQSTVNIRAVLTFSQGEQHKNLKTIESLINQLQDLHITRNDTLIALGGGIVGDVTGFLAAIYLRGIDYYNIPTTLLSQIDSSVGGKVGVNSEKAKNAIGQFKQPKAVFIDPNVLKTLDERQYNNGMAELIKHAIIKDETLFNDLANIDFDSNIIDFIYRSISIKKDVIIQDVFDYSERQLLNYGHTIAHAIEKASNHQIYHGEAVAIGMVIMAKDCENVEIIKSLLGKFNLPTQTHFNYQDLLPYMLNDKKLKQDKITLIIVKKIGHAFLKEGRVADLESYLSKRG